MDYNEAKLKVFATGTVPDGYFGKRKSVGFALLGNRIITVAPCGCFNAGMPDATDNREALWLLRRHPSARNITITTAHAFGRSEKIIDK